jgi:uncharacterized membrane protein
MGKGRLEAFSDGVIAIIITIMVLEIKVPQGDDLTALEPLLSDLLSYVLSFVYIGIYWNNHHHMLHATTQVSGRILWCNLHLLFWLSLVPIATHWLGENPSSSWPAAVYGVVLFMAAIAFTLLQMAIVAINGSASLLRTAVGADLKGKLSLGLYVLGMLCAFVRPWISEALYVLVAAMWFIPDPRIEKALVEKGSG